VSFIEHWWIHIKKQSENCIVVINIVACARLNTSVPVVEQQMLSLSAGARLGLCGKSGMERDDLSSEVNYKNERYT
jgi:hypothetical protein